MRPMMVMRPPRHQQPDKSANQVDKEEYPRDDKGDYPGFCHDGGQERGEGVPDSRSEG